MGVLNVVAEPLLQLSMHPLAPLVVLMGAGVATVTDVKWMKIPNWLNGGLLFIRLALIFEFGTFAFPLTMTHFLGGFIGMLMLLIPAMALMHKMGGDIKFVGVVGLYLGLPLTIAMLAVASATMLCVTGIRKYLMQKATAETKKVLVPFAPYFTFAITVLLAIGLLIENGVIV